jgi:hypothetical protein
LKDFLKNRLFSNGVIKAITVIAVFAISITILNRVIFPLFGFKFSYDSGALRITRVVKYSEDEAQILEILIKDTVKLGEIPQFEYLASKTGMDEQRLSHTLGSLAEKGDIAVDSGGAIVAAYPWTSRESDISVYLISDGQSIAGPLRTAGALYAMSAISLFDGGGRIEAVWEGLRESLVIEVENDEIVYTSNIAAVAYRTDDYKDSRFFASSDDAREYYSDKFELDRVIRLDRALLIGNIIAEGIKEKIR